MRRSDREPLPSFMNVPYVLGAGDDDAEGETWLMEGHYLPGRDEDFSGRPDRWDDGDPAEVEIWHLTNRLTRERITHAEFAERFALPESAYQDMIENVLNHFSGRGEAR